MTPERLAEIRNGIQLPAVRQLLVEVDRMVAALTQIEAHHTALNEYQGRPISHSKTIRLAREGLGKDTL